jgi:hypothetical protein
MERDADLSGVLDASDSMSSETSQHGDASTASRQKHDSGRTGSSIEGQSFTVCIEFGREVEIMYSGTGCGRHERLGRVCEGASGVEQNGDAREFGHDGIGIVQREEPDTCVETVCQRLKFRPVLFATGENEVESDRRGMLGRHATSITGGAVDHESVHVDGSSSVIIRDLRRCA